jgi:hypothetical protein
MVNQSKPLSEQAAVRQSYSGDSGCAVVKKDGGVKLRGYSRRQKGELPYERVKRTIR